MSFFKNAIRINIFIIFVLFVAISFTTNTANAEYPEKPLRCMVIFSAGGPTDTEIRILTKYAEEYLGENIVIDNVPGAGGIVGWNTLPDRSTDGYFLTNINLPHILNYPLVRDTKFTFKSFDPIILASADPTIFAVRKDSPIKSFDDLIERASQNPGEITVGTAGLYLAHHVAVLQVEKEKDVEFTTVPFKGSANSMKALLGGQVDVLSDTLSDMIRLGIDEKVRVFAVSGKERYDLAPDIPTFREHGVDAYIPSSDRGIAVPAGTPQEKIDILTEAFHKAANSPEYQEEMEKAGYVLNILTPEECEKAFVERSKRLKKVLEDLDAVKEVPEELQDVFE